MHPMGTSGCSLNYTCCGDSYIVREIRECAAKRDAVLHPLIQTNKDKDIKPTFRYAFCSNVSIRCIVGGGRGTYGLILFASSGCSGGTSSASILVLRGTILCDCDAPMV